MTIKFRAKKITNGDWVYGDLFHAKSGITIIENGGESRSDFHFVDEKTVGQYIGIKSVNGVEIYKDDIVVLPNEYPFFDLENGEQTQTLNYIGIVDWIYSKWQYVLQCVNPDKSGISDGINHGLNNVGFNDNENTDWLIIGNTHDDLERLTQNRLNKRGHL